ncbi:hypothetical protein PIB30_000715 [Stylosanthes scabra]|uniref:Uncharacterized protein n=1 Tax=Stylosanthes scabra TaxID=79078 RepID=A0ABU6Z0G0_9FABA|nr:hypothetical protein [Stylosanthes scabra]
MDKKSRSPISRDRAAARPRWRVHATPFLIRKFSVDGALVPFRWCDRATPSLCGEVREDRLFKFQGPRTVALDELPRTYGTGLIPLTRPLDRDGHRVSGTPFNVLVAKDAIRHLFLQDNTFYRLLVRPHQISSTSLFTTTLLRISNNSRSLSSFELYKPVLQDKLQTHISFNTPPSLNVAPSQVLTLGPAAYAHGRPEDSYSMGIRKKLANEFGSSPNKDGNVGKQHADDVIVTPLRSENYHADLASSVFCSVLPGDCWCR